MSRPWVRIRQVVLAVPDIAEASARLRAEFALAPGFADPLLADVGMDDESIVLGNGATYLEFVAPLSPDTSVQRWLDRTGPGGYALSIQVDDLDPFRERIAASGLRLAADVEVYGHRIVQLHPKDLGLLVELDEIADHDAWFWDDHPKQVPEQPLVDDVLALELTNPDPATQAARWAQLFGAGPVEEEDGAYRIVLGERPVHFVAGSQPCLSAVELRARPGHADGVERMLSGVRFRLR